ncbi:hypothetical protein ALC53_13484 [Atta colombica]|uniref:Uncharacterized protein n=1 Tax=Atta colombica TaxID=520822 RepID=A0A195AVJ9_9HYME|nr:hypothetical protein ALC53_13484 [Atta colombica]
MQDCRVESPGNNSDDARTDRRMACEWVGQETEWLCARAVSTSSTGGSSRDNPLIRSNNVDLSTLADCYLSHPVRTGCSGINKQRSHGLEMYKYHIIFSVSDGSFRSKFKFAFAAYQIQIRLQKNESATPCIVSLFLSLSFLCSASVRSRFLRLSTHIRVLSFCRTCYEFLHVREA